MSNAWRSSLLKSIGSSRELYVEDSNMCFLLVKKTSTVPDKDSLPDGDCGCDLRASVYIFDLRRFIVNVAEYVGFSL